MKHHGVSERWRQQLGALRAALDQHISAIEAALDESDRDLLAETQQMKTAMAEAQTHLVELTAELAKTRQRLSDVSSAKASLQAQYQQLASQRMTDALSQMLQGREDAAPSKAAPPPSTPAAGPTLTSVPAISAPKKPLQFSERARDAKRVRIRRGIHVSVDGVIGELVDLSLGGAQVLLTQAVRPNQLVRLTIPRVEGQVNCRGRVVWATYEQPATSLSVYRTGVKFTESDATVLEKVMNDFGEKPVFIQSRSSSDVA